MKNSFSLLATHTQVVPYADAKVGDWVYFDDIPEHLPVDWPKCLLYQSRWNSLVVSDGDMKIFDSGGGLVLDLLGDVRGYTVKQVYQRVR